MTEPHESHESFLLRGSLDYEIIALKNGESAVCLSTSVGLFLVIHCCAVQQECSYF